MRAHRSIALETPYRLDLTVDALRRICANAVDVAGGGAYRRALADERGSNAVEVTQSGRTLDVIVYGKNGERWFPTVERMLGVRADVREWYRRVQGFPWLDRLAQRFRGVRPPQYPTVWEALSHAIVFQQISIHAAGAIMRRMVEDLSPPVECSGVALRPFPAPQHLLAAGEHRLRGAGLSANKIAHLRSAAEAVVAGSVNSDRLAALSSTEAAAELARVRGIGPWSAAVILLRGLGRLDVFPMKDSGVARSLPLLCGDALVDAAALLDALGPVRGMLYYHLLLGRITRPAPLRVSTPPATRSLKAR